MFVVDLLSLLVAATVAVLSWRWHDQTSRDAAAAGKRADEALRVASDAAAAQTRLANVEPWRTERKSQHWVLFRNLTGAEASHVTISVSTPWWFADHGEDNWAPDLGTVKHERIPAGGSVMHALTTDSGPRINARVVVGWYGPDGKAQYWEEPAAWAVLPD